MLHPAAKRGGVFVFCHFCRMLALSLPAAVVALFCFERCCHWLAPGTHERSRFLYAGLLFGLSPVFVREVVLGSVEVIFWAAFLAAIAAAARLLDFRKRRETPVFVLLAGLAFCLKIWLLPPSPTLPNGLPKAVFLLAPLFHPGFFVLLPALFLLVKRTDFQLFAKKCLLILLGLWLAWAAMLPVQRLSDLFPAYAVVLLLLFPAWDRFVAYGFYFLERRWMRLALGVFALVQLGASVWFLIA